MLHEFCLFHGFFFMLFSFSTMFHLSHENDACSSECTCKWKNGKQTAECVGVNLSGIPEGLSAETQVLYLTGNLLQTLSDRAFQKAGLVNLQKVYASRCGILSIADNAFYQLSNLVELDLSNNFIRVIPVTALRDTTLLRRLLLNHNPIQKIENNSFILLERLTVLELSHCQLEDVEPSAFDGLKSLEYLKLDNNQLKSLPPEIVRPFPKLYALDLHQNPWRCDCRIRSVRVWMERHNVPISSPPQCSEPRRMRGMSWDDVNTNDFACKSEVTAVDSSITFNVGDNATLGCRIHAIPESGVNWISKGRVISNLTLMSFGRQMYLIREVGTTHKVSSLTIFNVMLKDSGRYLCVANNPAGRISANITLEVTSKEENSNSLSGEEIAGIVAGVLFVFFAFFFIFSFLVMRHQRMFPDRHKGGLSIYKYFVTLNRNNPDSNAKNVVVVDGSAIGTLGSDTVDVVLPKCNASPISQGSGSDHSAYGVAKKNNIIPTEQYSVHESFNSPTIVSPNSEKKFGSLLNRHSIRETEKGIEMFMHPVDKDIAENRDEMFGKAPNGDVERYAEVKKTEYIRKIPNETNDEEDDISDRSAVVFDLKNSADGSFLIDSDISSLNCSVWPLSESTFKDESYHSYNSPSQSSWKRSSVMIPQQIHHIFSPDARDSPDEGLGDEREYETDILD